MLYNVFVITDLNIGEKVKYIKKTYYYIFKQLLNIRF